MKDMLKIKKEASLYKDLEPKELKKIIKGYKQLMFKNSDLYNFIFTLSFILIPYLLFFSISLISFCLIILFHYLFFWEYLHKYKKSKIVSDVDNEEISEIVKILEGYLDDKTKTNLFLIKWFLWFFTK
jgi:hypothetical protein